MAKKVLLGLGVLIITVFGLAFFFDRYQTKPADQTLASGGGEIASDLHETQPGPGWEEVLGEDQKKAGEMGDIVPRDSPTPVIGNDDSDPVFDGLRLGGTSVVKGGTITVYVYAHDEESGLRDGDMRAVDGTGDLDVRAESHCNKISDDQLRCDLEIPQYATAGVWHVAYVNINDIAGRQLYVSFGESEYTFTVEASGGEDNEKPIFDRLELSASSTGKGGVITVYVYAHDEESGLRDGDMRAVDGTGDLDVRAESHCNKISDDQLRCDLEIPQYATAGVWHVAYVNINDVAGRQLHVSFGESDYTFTVGL